MKKYIIISGWFVSLLLLSSILSGCTMTDLSSTKNNNLNTIYSYPELGIQEWVNAVNTKDVKALYNLEPDSVKQQISYAQFVTMNEQNQLLEPNSSLTSFEVLNETRNGTSANFIIIANWQGTVAQNSTQIKTAPIFYHFKEIFEDGIWKVWTES